jgi:hypothetical protein
MSSTPLQTMGQSSQQAPPQRVDQVAVNYRMRSDSGKFFYSWRRGNMLITSRHAHPSVSAHGRSIHSILHGAARSLEDAGLFAWPIQHGAECIWACRYRIIQQFPRNQSEVDKDTDWCNYTGREPLIASSYPAIPIS